MINIDKLRRKLQNLTVDEACWLLKLYGCQHDALKFHGSAMTPYELNIAHEIRCASAVWEVSFIGGPKRRRGVYMGTLLTFVIDRLLRAHEQRGIDYSWILHFNGGTTNHIRTQLRNRVPSALLQMSLFDDPVGEDNPVMEYARIDGKIYPIYEDGRQGRATKFVVSTP